MKLKIIALIIVIICIDLGTAKCANAQEIQSVSGVDKTENYYKEQVEHSGANKLWSKLPNETKKELANMGIDENLEWQKLVSLNTWTAFGTLNKLARLYSKTPLIVSVNVIGIMILCALMEGMKLSFSEKPLGGIISVISILCICAVIIEPLVGCIDRTTKVIHAAAIFMLAYIPVITGIMIAGGQIFSAGSYNVMMMTVSEIIAQISSIFLLPMFNVFLSLSIISAISPRLNFKNIGNFILSSSKWILGILMSIFVGVLSLRNVVGKSADGASNKAIKFAMSTFVPVVGSALGEAFSTVRSSVKLLKSGVGAFGILAGICIFLPILVESVLWILTLNACACFSDLFLLNNISDLLRSASKVMGLLISVTLTYMFIIIISTGIVLTSGGGEP